MNLGFWNVWGLHVLSKQREVFSFISSNNMDIFGLLETKLNSTTLDKLRKNYLQSWSFFNNFDIPRNGRILLVWNPTRVTIDGFTVEPQVIHAKGECLVSGNKFHLALCYGKNQLQDRRLLWDSLIAHAPTDLPILLCGDLNNVMDYDERVGGRQPIEREVRELVDTAAYLNLQDSPSTGCFFKWSDRTVFSRIDRMFHNGAWLEEWWTIKTHFHTRKARFDHSACTTELFNPVKRFRREFKYCNFWNSDPKFQEILEDSWSRDVGSLVGQQRLTLKLRHLRADLGPLKKRD